MIILIILLSFHLLVLFTGKYAERMSYLGYLFTGLLTAVQVLVFAYLLFTMEVPTP